MGCNCGKDKIKLSIRKRMRREVKEKIADIRKIWNESGESEKITIDKRKLNFK